VKITIDVHVFFWSCAKPVLAVRTVPVGKPIKLALTALYTIGLHSV